MDKFTQVDGLKTRYQEEGTGPAAVFVHGASLGSSADVYQETLSTLAKRGFRAIAFDQPGYGYSDNPSDYRASYRMQFIPKFIDALGLGKACVAGHSQAGIMVLRLALDRCPQVSKAVVIGTGPLLPPLVDQGGRGRERGGDEEGDSEPTLESTKKLLEENTFNKALITPEVLEKRYQLSIGKNFEASKQRANARERSTDEVPLWQRLKEVPVPLLMLYGAQDRGSAGKRAALLKQKEPSIRVEVVDNAAHMIMWDAKESFCKKIYDFLSA
ncbi:MAG TPA: alpha/beta hydrolase [Candidatus Binatia bacterium]|jgi:pimeloyl-ACP methyl ester carboxylesterase|nr:alpha/beta hydrolase [Candidatus Binatia bacterium]